MVGFTAILSAAYLFPRYLALPVPVRLLLQVATLLGGSVFGTGIVITIYPCSSCMNSGPRSGSSS